MAYVGVRRRIKPLPSKNILVFWCIWVDLDGARSVWVMASLRARNRCVSKGQWRVPRIGEVAENVWGVVVRRIVSNASAKFFDL